jgi:hypothetical protein
MVFNVHHVTRQGRVSGQYLARNHLTKRARAQLAARIIGGEVEIGRLTNKQVAALCGVSVAYVALMRGGRKPVRAPAPPRVVDWLSIECLNDEALAGFIGKVGIDRVLGAAVQVERSLGTAATA